MEKGETEVIKENTKIAEEILIKLIEKLEEGISTYELDKIAKREFKKYKAKPAAFLFGYSNYISVAKNEQIFFGPITKEEILKEGDIVKIALGLFKNGYFTDLGFSFLIGEVSEEKLRLIKGTADAFYKAIEKIKPNVKIHNISKTIEETLCSYNLSPIYEILGHGVGRNLHEPPYVPNSTSLPLINYQYKIKEGEIVCIEPIATTGKGKIKKREKKMNLVTTDKKPVAHFELPILIKKEPEVLAKELYDLIVKTAKQEAKR